MEIIRSVSSAYQIEEKKDEKIINEIVGFIKQSIIGTESAFYKYISFTKNTMKELKINSMKNSINSMLINYLNDCYKSLITSNDVYLLKTFRPVQKELNHSEKCVLILVGQVINLIVQIFDRKNLKTSSFDRYIQSVSNELSSQSISNLLSSFQKNLRNHLTNECLVGNIKDENQDDILFSKVLLEN
jgi:hypothetical protein